MRKTGSRRRCPRLECSNGHVPINGRSGKGTTSCNGIGPPKGPRWQRRHDLQDKRSPGSPIFSQTAGFLPDEKDERPLVGASSRMTVASRSFSATERPRVAFFGRKSWLFCQIPGQWSRSAPPEQAPSNLEHSPARQYTGLIQSCMHLPIENKKGLGEKTAGRWVFSPRHQALRGTQDRKIGHVGRNGGCTRPGETGGSPSSANATRSPTPSGR